MRTEKPFVRHGKIPAHGQVDVGMKVKLILPNNDEADVFVVGLRMCSDSLQSPLLLLSDLVDPAEYSFTMVLPNIEYKALKRDVHTWYYQVYDRSGSAAQSHTQQLFTRIRRFRRDCHAHLAFPLGPPSKPKPKEAPAPRGSACSSWYEILAREEMRPAYWY